MIESPHCSAEETDVHSFNIHLTNIYGTLTLCHIPYHMPGHRDKSGPGFSCPRAREEDKQILVKLSQKCVLTNF